MKLSFEQILHAFTNEQQALLKNQVSDYNQVKVPKQLSQIWPPSVTDSDVDQLCIETFWRQYHLSEQLDNMAYPLSSKAIAFVQQKSLLVEGEHFPQFPYLITTLTSLLVRQWCIWGIQLYIEVSGSDATINTEIVKMLQSPTDNQWWALLSLEDPSRGILKWLNKQKISRAEQKLLLKCFQSIFSRAPTWNESVERDARSIHNISGSGKAQPIKKVAQLVKYLLKYRNALIHAEPLTAQDTQDAALVLECLLQSALPLNAFVMRSMVEGTLYELKGMFPTTIENTAELKTSTDTINNRDMVLYHNNTTLFSLSPLMTLAQDIDAIDEEKDIYFINKGSLRMLKYVGFVNGAQQDGHSLGSYETFKQYLATIPIPQGGTDNPIIDFTDFAANKGKNFVGRSDVLAEIESNILNKGGHYIFLKALAGMGKSAIMTHLHQQFYDSKENLPTTDTPQDNIWLFHFCMHTNGRDNAVTAYRSLLTQLQQALGTYNKKRKPSMDIKELKELFQSTLNGAKKKLDKLNKKRIVVVLDALDEISFMEEDNIINSIPESIQEHVVFLCSYRVKDNGQNQRVQRRLQGLPSEQCITLESANPLKGLTKEDVKLFLSKLHSKEQSAITVHETVWLAASTELGDFADPFYLRFVADGVEKRQYFLTRPETIPTSLNGAFEQMWLSLPNDRNFLAHRLLVTLGIMRDLGDDELFAELFTRQFEETFSEEDIAIIRRPIGKLLSYDGDRYGLFHDRFRYFLVGEQKDPIAEALALKE
jgi:hypothetical protein